MRRIPPLSSLLPSFRRQPGLRTPAAAVAAALLWAAVGCSGATATPTDVTPTATPADTTTAAAEPTATPAPVIQVPTADVINDAIQSHLATTVLEVGTQRVAFLLTTQRALVNAPQAQISVVHQGGAAPPSQVTAPYHEWPYGVRGSYSASVDFPEPGRYLMTVAPVGGDAPGEALIELDVLAEAPVPSIGDTPPSSRTKTLGSGLDLTELTTAYQPDAALYRQSIADAIASGRPSVIVFATPAFCTSPTCGPQVDTVSELRAAHPDAANYIHVELYDNPQEIQGDLSQARLVRAADEWGFTQIPEWTNESWVFVLDAEGIIRHRFEGFATLAELTAALGDVTG